MFWPAQCDRVICTHPPNVNDLITYLAIFRRSANGGAKELMLQLQRTSPKRVSA